LAQVVGIDTCAEIEPAGTLNGQPRFRRQGQVELVLGDQSLLVWWGTASDHAEPIAAALRSAVDEDLPMVEGEGYPPHMSLRPMSVALVAASLLAAGGAGWAAGQLPEAISPSVISLVAFLPLLLLRATLWRLEAPRRLPVIAGAAAERYAQLRSGQSN